MATEFKELSDRWVHAYLEPDEKKRKALKDEWYRKAVPVIQAAVPDELKTYMEYWDDYWAEKDESGFESLANKWRRVQITLTLDIALKAQGDRPEPLADPPGVSWLRKVPAKLKLH